jgi:DNA polymerase V
VLDKHHTYICIDLKSFYASVECAERGLDPLTTNLVVADVSRTEKTICLAVSPALKAYGLPGRVRLFEVIRKVREINAGRREKASGHHFIGKSVSSIELKEHPEQELDYIAATPRMSYYISYSARIYQIYLKYIAAEDIHVYSIDEVFMDVTAYLESYKMTARELAVKMIQDVLKQTGITATAGIGTNLYLSKVAMDIVAKHVPADKDGVRIAELDEMSYRRQLWDYRPLTDFWRVGRGTANRLAMYNIFTMGQVARQSVENEEVLYRLFGVNAELLIDHAWGWEPCTMKDIKTYQPETHSLSTGQVLPCAYNFQRARVVVQEMADQMALQLVEKHLVTGQLILTVCFDRESLENPSFHYEGDVAADYYGRKVPKPVHGSVNLGRQTSSSRLIIEGFLKIYDRIVNEELMVRRMYVVANHVVGENEMEKSGQQPVQLDMFTDYDALREKEEKENEALKKERKLQETILDIKKKFGKNALLKGLDFADGATARERNEQIGGHRK